MVVLAFCGCHRTPEPPSDKGANTTPVAGETVALKYSDDPNFKTDHGKLGKIGRNQRDKAFTDYAFALLKFETGPVPLDTPAGFEVIRRME